MDRRVSNQLRWISLAWLGLVVICPDMQGQRIPMSMPPEMAAPAGQQQSPNPGAMKMRVVDGTVIAEITSTPLQTVLLELAERTGIIFEIRTQENPLVTLRLDKVPLQEAIKRIASSCNTIFLYGQGAAEPEHITMVRVFPRTNPLQQPAIAYLGTGIVTRSNDLIETPEQALVALAERKDIEGKEKAIEILVASKTDAAVEALAGSIADPAPEIRIAAIEGLATLQAHAALPEIVKCLRDSHPRVRQSAATAVALLGDATNINDIKPLRSDKDSSVAAAAETAIRKLSAAAPARKQ
jgi:hypothetical protein